MVNKRSKCFSSSRTSSRCYDCECRRGKGSHSLRSVCLKHKKGKCTCNIFCSQQIRKGLFCIKLYKKSQMFTPELLYPFYRRSSLALFISRLIVVRWLCSRIFKVFAKTVSCVEFKYKTLQQKRKWKHTLLIQISIFSSSYSQWNWNW